MMLAYLDVKKEDVSGKTIEIFHDISRSFLHTFPGMLAAMFAQASTNIRDVTSDTPVSLGIARYWSLRCQTGGGEGPMGIFFGTSSNFTKASYFGIQVGNGSGATLIPTLRDLGTRIASGSGSANLRYLGTICSNYVEDVAANSDSFDIEGYFKYEYSSGSINVNEVGLYLLWPQSSTNWDLTNSFCAIRDNISAVTLFPGEYLKVKYTLQITT